MPGYRFGPTARRPTQPRPVGGFQPIGPGTTGFQRSGIQRVGPGSQGFQPIGLTPQQQALDRLRNADIPDWARSQLEHQVLSGTKSRYSRPLSVLGGIARVLGIGENVAVGMIESLSEDFREVARDPVSPWVWLNAVSGIDNYKDVASAVKENRTYEKWLRESNDPGSFLYNNAFVIGLGLSIFGDPTTYLSFGVTSASKQAATKMWLAASYSTADEVQTAMRLGKIARTGETIAKYGNDERQIFHAIHLAAGRPYSVGDALEDLRRADKGLMPDIDPKYLEELGVRVATPRGPIRRTLRKRFARGGQGMRFAGVEIAGTRGLLGKTAGAVEEVTPGMARGDIRSGLLSAFSWAMPKEKLYRIHDDLTRATAMAEYTRAVQTLSFERFAAFDEAAQLFIMDFNKAAKLRAKPSLARGAVAIRSFFDRTPAAVPPRDRANLFKPGHKPTGIYSLYLKDMRAKGLETRDNMLDALKLEGFDDRALKDAMAEWDRLVAKHSDPLEVIGRWQAHMAARLASLRLADQMVHNPLLARPWHKSVGEMDEALVRLEDEMANLNKKLANVTQKLGTPHHAFGPPDFVQRTEAQLARSKTQLKRIQGDLIERSRVLSRDYNTLLEERRLGEVRSMGVTTEDQARRIFQEDVVPYSHRGQKYLMPAPIAWALEQIKNPQLVDQELRKFLRVINYPQNKWKIAATSLNPRFWWMNAVGGMWNNMLGGVYNPGDYLEQLGDRVRVNLVEHTDEGLVRSLLRPAARRVSAEDYTRGKEVAAAFEARQVGGGMVGFEIHPSITEIRRKARAPGKARQAFTSARRTYAATSVGISVAPDDWVPDELEELKLGGQPVFNPLAGILMGLPELTRGGRFMTQEVETSLRETPLRVAMKDPSYYQLMDAYSVAPPVNFGRWMGQVDIGRSQAARELTWDIGAAMAIRYQFDYTDLTVIERDLMKTIFPFYVFNKNNFVLQAQELVQRPRFVATAMDVGNFLNYTTETEQNSFFQELLPEYFDKLHMFRVPVPNSFRGALGLPEDQDVYLNPMLPYATLNLMPPLWQAFQQDTITPSNYRWLQVMSPILGSIGPVSTGLPIKPLIEYSVGYNLGLARPIDYQMLQSGGWRNSPREAPGWMRFAPGPLQDLWGVYKDPQSGQLMMNASMRYIVDQMATPFISSTGDVFNWQGTGLESERTRLNSFAFISGIRLTPVDPLRLQRGWLYRIESFLEARKANAKVRGETFPREDEIFLRQLRAQIKVIEHAWDTKQEALYGK